MLRWALRAETGAVRGVVEAKGGCLLCSCREEISVSNCAAMGSSVIESAVDGSMVMRQWIL